MRSLVSANMHGIRLQAVFLLFLLLFLPVIALQSHAATLQEIDIVSEDASTYVILTIDEKVDYKQNTLPLSSALPARCYVDLFKTDPGKSLAPRQVIDNQHITTVRSCIFQDKLRIVLDLDNDYVCSVSDSSSLPFQIKVSVTNRNAPETEQGAAPRQESLGMVTNMTVASTEMGAQALSSNASCPETVNLKTEPAVATDSLQLQQPSSDNGIVSTWGWAKYYYAYDPKIDYSEDRDLSRVQGRVGAEWSREISSDYSLDIHAAVGLDKFYYDSDLADDETDIDLYETFLRLNSADWDLSFGKQRVRWGKSDQLSPVDSLNPEDFRQFVTIDLEERALPSWMLRGRWQGQAIGMEAIVQPWFQKSEIEYFDSDWAIYRDLRQSIMDDTQAPENVKDYVRNLHTSTDKPNKTLDNMSAAGRFTWNSEQADFALSYHYGWETLPTITSFPVKNISYSGDPDVDLNELLENTVFTDERVLSEYKRQQTAGFEWETVLDPIGLRGEIAYIDHVSFLSNDLTSKRNPVTHLVSGIDYTSATEWYFNLQGSWFHIHDYTDKILYFEEDNVALLGVIRKPVWRGNLELAVKYNYTITDGSSYLQPSATLKYFRNVECEVGANLFNGDGDTLFGSYDHADQLYGLLKLSF